MQLPDVTVAFGFSVALEVSVGGEIFKNNIRQPNSSITLSGKLEFNGLAISGILSMVGMWRKVFGVSFIAIGQLTLGLEISLAGMPTGFQLEGRLELGNECYFPEDFKLEGPCISQHVKVGINPTKPQDFFIYADLSPVSLGKILRMLGSKLIIPSPVESAGFPEGLTISGALTDEEITYNDQVKKVKKGVFINGKVNLFGLAFSLTLEISDKNIFCETGLDPINIANGVVVTRSPTDKANGPIFKLSAARDPLDIEVLLEGAVRIFGVETAILFKLTREQIEAALNINLFHKLAAQLSITAGYGGSLEKTGFTAKFVVSTGFGEIEEGSSKDVRSSIQKARENLQEAQQLLRETNIECRKKVASYCTLCQSIACEQITENCHLAMDKFKHYIGGSVNRFGGWFVDVAKEIASHFRTRDRRYIEFFPGRAQLMTKLRRKRFVGKVLCEDIAPAICKGSRMLCQGSCSITKHVTKGVCWALDKAQSLLHTVENVTYWAKRAAQIFQDHMLVIHSLGFEVALSPSALSKVAATLDVTFFKTRQQFSMELSLQSLKRNAKKIADLAIAGFSEIYKSRLSDPVYDRPNTAADFALSGTFRIQNSESKACLSTPDLRAGTDIKMAVCVEDSSRWTYTLTGQILNIQSGLCLSVAAMEGKKLQQLECKIKGMDQNFICEKNSLRLEGTELCVTEEGVEKVAILKRCDDENSRTYQRWGVKGDPRKMVCDEFVPDVALGKPATQSSKFQYEDIGKTDYIDPEDQNAVFYQVGPELAVDGDMSAFLRDGSCSHTRQDQDPWWRVELLREHVVTDVTVVSPYGGLKVEPLANFEIRVGMSRDFEKNPMCGERVGQLHYGEVWTSKCEPPISGQYVSVQRFGKVFMTICEVAVFARLDNQGKCTKELKRKRREISEGLQERNTP